MRRTAGLAGVCLLLAGAFALGLVLTRSGATGDEPFASVPRDHPPQLVDEVRLELVTGYYRSVPPAVFAAESVEEAIARLGDPYTDYLSPRDYAELRSRTARAYSGVGLTVGPAKEGLVVKSAVDGPARDAGIRPGDRIVSIDGQHTRTLPFQRSLALIKGKAGTVVRLRVLRPREGTFRLAVKREEITLPAVRARIVRARGTKLGYLRLLSFRASVDETLADRAARLVKRGAKGLVVDLRDNPGGLLSQAVATVSLFVDRGAVCTTDGANHGRRVYRVSGKAVYRRIPLVVLVDRGSASAAEIVAAALRDHGRAVVVGERTYGKAAVQSVRELSNGAALRMTTAVFVTPAGKNLTARGLTPDVRGADKPGTRADEGLAAAKAALVDQIAR